MSGGARPVGPGAAARPATVEPVEPRAVLLTGVFGVGKTTLIEDIAEVLDQLEIPHAALDLDWLAWSNAAGPGRSAEHRLMVANLASVTANYRRAGATHFVLARTIRDRSELVDVAASLDMSVTVVEVTLPFDEIARRLAGHPTSARRRDLATSRRWIEAGPQAGLADHTVRNDRPVREVAVDVLGLLGWPGPSSPGS